MDERYQRYKDNVVHEFCNRHEPNDWIINTILMTEESIGNLSYREYKTAGDYWNKYPKTDYTYSPLSPFRREVAPGIVAMPNMSRKSLKTRSRSVCRCNISSDHFNLQECRRIHSANLKKKEELTSSGNDSLITIEQSFHIWTCCSNIVNKVSTLFSSVRWLPYKKKQESCKWQPTLINFSFEKMDDWSLMDFELTSLDPLRRASIALRAFYFVISSILHIDTLLLWSENRKYTRCSFWIAMIFLFLIFTNTVFYATEHPNNSVNPVQSLIFIFFSNVHQKIFSTDPRKRLTYNLNGFWVSLQSSDLLRKNKLDMQFDSTYEYKKNKIRFYNRILKTCRKSEEEYHTNNCSYNKLNIADLFAIDWHVWFMTSKDINSILWRSFEEYNHESYVNHISYNISHCVHELNITSSVANKNAKLKAFNTTSQTKQINAAQYENTANMKWHNKLMQNKDEINQLNHYILSSHEDCLRTFRKSISRMLALLRQNIMARIRMEIRKSIYYSDDKNRFILQEQDIRGIINEVVAKYDADKTGRVDYALETAGGQVLSTRCTENYNTKAAQLSIFGIPLWTPSNSPRIAISPSVHPGECWAFQGFPGFLVIKLNTFVYVTGFTVEHVRKSLTPYGRIDSAPKNFTVWGLVNEDDHQPTFFGQYQFLDNNIALQYFPVKSKAKRKFSIIELKIESNHGNELYTCLYRFRVHGTP